MSVLYEWHILYEELKNLKYWQPFYFLFLKIMDSQAIVKKNVQGCPMYCFPSGNILNNCSIVSSRYMTLLQFILSSLVL